MKNITYGFLFLLATTLAVSFMGCSKPKVEDRGLSETSLNADFTVTPVSGSANRFILKAADSSYILSKWDLGDGAGASTGSPTKEIFLPDAGAYTITHYAVGKGGQGFTATKNVTVATSDPNAGNLVQGGKFANATDWAKWTLNNTNPNGNAKWTFTAGKATLTSNGWSGSGIYQAIPVVAGKKYKVDMVASSTSGCVDTWFEVYIGYNVPVFGSDYNGDPSVHKYPYRSINTWDGSGKAAFSGKISDLGTVNADKNLGVFTATQTGTIYLGIRGGGSDMKDGISITNVEFRGTN